MAKKKIAPPADLAELDRVVEAQETGILIPIMHVDGVSPLGFSVRVAGPDSSRAQRAREIMQQELVNRGSLEPLSPAESLEQGVRYLARITMGWEPQIKLDGKILEYSEENAVNLYNRFRFIRQQVDSKAGQRELFLSQSGETSSPPSGEE